MDELARARGEIDEADAQMAALFERRMEAAAEIAQHKSRHGLPVLDAGREAQVLEKNLPRIQKAALQEFYADFLQHLMSLSRQFQLREQGRDSLAYQGTEGGFGQLVAAALYPHARAVAKATFDEVFDAVEGGEAALGIVPFENSSTGDVAGVLDLCYTHPGCHVVGMHDLPVQQNLLALPGATLAGIKTVFSHPQALAQSARFLEALAVETKPFANTALAAQRVAEAKDTSLAAIASLDAAARFGLLPLAKDISTEADNTTRFLVLAGAPATQGDRFSLLVTLQHEVGSLARVIETISRQGFNMESIKSRPMPKRPWEYYFYIELLGSGGGEPPGELLAQLEQVCLSVRLLGVFYRTEG